MSKAKRTVFVCGIDNLVGIIVLYQQDCRYHKQKLFALP